MWEPGSTRHNSHGVLLQEQGRIYIYRGLAAVAACRLRQVSGFRASAAGWDQLVMKCGMCWQAGTTSGGPKPMYSYSSGTKVLTNEMTNR